MAGSGVSRAQENRRIRQEALKEQLSSQGHVQHILDLSTKLENLTEELDPTQVNRLKIVMESKFKLLNKYLPDEKFLEIVADVDTSLTVVRKEYKSSK